MDAFNDCLDGSRRHSFFYFINSGECDTDQNVSRIIKVPRNEDQRSAMTRILTWCFEVPAEPRPWWKVVVWWEARRIPYNIVVGGFGIISLLLFFVFIHLAHELKQGEDAIEPIAIFVAPILINFTYTAGWVVELLVRVAWRERPRRIGPTLLKWGLILSLGITFLPAAIWFTIWLWRMVRS